MARPRLPSPAALLLAAALALWPSTAPLQAAPLETAAAVSTRFDELRWVPEREALLMSFVGPAPEYVVRRRSASTYDVDFVDTGAVPDAAIVGSPGGDHPVLARWAGIRFLRQGMLRMSFELTGPGELHFFMDPGMRRLWVFPQRDSALGPALARGPQKKAWIGHGAYDPVLGALAFPYYGEPPLYAITRVSPRNFYVEFLDADLDPARSQFGWLEADPSLNTWVLTRRPGLNMARVSLVLPEERELSVQVDRPGKRLVVQPGQPVEPPPFWAGLSLPGLGIGAWAMPASYQEEYAAGGQSLSTQGVNVFGLDLASEWPEGWRERLRLGYTSYGYEDGLVPPIKHDRRELRADFGLTRRFEAGPLGLEAGLGYFLRSETATHASFPALSYAFAVARSYHGPELVGRADMFGLYLVGQFAPLVFTSVPVGIPALPSLMAYRFEAGCDVPLGPFRAALAFRRWQTFGSGYDEVFQGPVVGLTLGL